MLSMLAAAPSLLVKNGLRAGREYEVGSIVRIGRHPYNEVSVSDGAVSRYHCWITATGQGFFIEDLASSNGTWVNERQVTSRTPLKTGDVIRVGVTRIIFRQAAQRGALAA
jgi:pSer/pThr/pTyr-binding forkhead associated (FHA) protein